MLTNKNKKFLIDFGPKEHYNNADIGDQIRSQSPHRKADFDRHLEHANSLATSRRNEYMDHLASYASTDYQREKLLDLNSHREFHGSMDLISSVAKHCGNDLMRKLLDKHDLDLTEWMGHEVYNNENAKEATIEHLNNTSLHRRIGFPLDASMHSSIPEIRKAGVDYIVRKIKSGNMAQYEHRRVYDMLQWKQAKHSELKDTLKSIGYIDENEHDK